MATEWKNISNLILQHQVGTKIRPRDFATRFGLKLSSVYSIMTKLRKKGLLPPPAFARKGRATDKEFDEVAGIEWKEGDVQAVLSDAVMPELERLKKLSVMARFGPDAISISAIKALEELSKAKGTSVGPGKPLTEDEQVSRLARLCLAVGREVSERAFSVAFPSQEAVDALPQKESGQFYQGTSLSSSDLDRREPQNGG